MAKLYSKVSTRKGSSQSKVFLKNIFLLLVGKKAGWNWAIFCEMRDVPNCWDQRRCSGCYFDHDEFIQTFPFWRCADQLQKETAKFLAWLFFSPNLGCMSLDRESLGWDLLLKIQQYWWWGQPKVYLLSMTDFRLASWSLVYEAPDWIVINSSKVWFSDFVTSMIWFLPTIHLDLLKMYILTSSIFFNHGQSSFVLVQIFF